jgi:hypothetical protein
MWRAKSRLQQHAGVHGHGRYRYAWQAGCEKQNVTGKGCIRIPEEKSTIRCAKDTLDILNKIYNKIKRNEKNILQTALPIGANGFLNFKFDPSRTLDIEVRVSSIPLSIMMNIHVFKKISQVKASSIDRVIYLGMLGSRLPCPR